MRTLLTALALLASGVCADAASLLPPGKLCLSDANGDPLAGGTINFYVPATTTPKTTWQNALETIANTNPVILNSAGCAVVYGSGVYRQIVKDSLGNLIWDQQVADPGINGVSWGGPASGTGNAIVITAEGFAQVDGQMVSWLATATNTGPMTLDASPSAPPLPLVKDTINGPSAMVGGEVHVGNVESAVYATFDARFHLVAPPFPTSGQSAVVAGLPGGRLTLDASNPVMVGNVPTVGTIYYSPFVGATIPIWNGNLFAPYTFSQLAADINATNHLADTLYDLFVIEDGTTERLCTGPAWTNSGASTSARSVGGGLTYKFGILVNLVAMPCRWGAGTATLTVPQFAATYVGTVLIDSTPGVTSWRPDPAAGSPPIGAELYLWNNYNRVAVKSLVIDNTATYPCNTCTMRPANSSTGNRISYVSGQLTDIVIITYKHRASAPAVVNATCNFGIDYNATTDPFYNNISAQVISETAVITTQNDSITNIMPANVGLAFVQATENANAACTFLPNGVLQAVLRM